MIVDWPAEHPSVECVAQDAPEPWVAYHPKTRDHIEECQRQLEGYQLAIEFRNKTWFEGKHAAVTLAFERERNLVNVIVDEPRGWPTRSRPFGR